MCVVALITSAAGACQCSRSKVTSFQPDVPYGGRAVAIGVRPGNDAEMIVASETGGLFRTVDGGTSWTHIEGVGSFTFSDVEFAPGNPDVVVATALADFHASNGGGAWRSTDGGLSWTHVPGSLPPAGPRCPDFASAYSVSFQPGSSTVFAGTDCGLARSSDLGATWTHIALDPAAGVNQTLTQNAVWSVLAQQDSRVHAAAADGIWYSTDDGVTWNRALAGPAAGHAGVPHAFAASPFSSEHVFLTAGNNRLFLTTDGGVVWIEQPIMEESFTHASFVRTALAVSEVPTDFDVYFGNGIHLHRQTFTHRSTAPVGFGQWTFLHLNHPDPTDIAFDDSGRFPILLATDGGVHRTSDNGANWQLTGTGTGGYNALQITEVTGSEVTGSDPHLDLYYATQDNYMGASEDGGTTWSVIRGTPFCCEGFFLETLPTSIDHASVKVNGVAISGPTRNFLSDPHMLNGVVFPNAPDNAADGDDQDGNPYFVRPGTYVERAVDDSQNPPVETHRRTMDTGNSWNDAYTLPERPAGRGIVVGVESQAVLYQPVARPGLTLNGLTRTGLVRVDNIAGPGLSAVTDADGAGFGSIGIFPTMFAHYRVFAADPNNPNHLIMADIEDDAMKRSYDYGETWEVDEALTAAVTGNGAFRFRKEKPYNRKKTSFTLVSAIAFDPSNSCHVLVGTRQNGVFRSTDGTRTWEKIKGSEVMTNLSSFYFPPTGEVIVSTYGRGLWKLDLERGGSCDGTIPVPFPYRPTPPSITFRDGVRREYPGTGRLPECPTCTLLLFQFGRLTDVRLRGDTLDEVWTSGGTVQQVGQDGQDVEQTVENRYRSDLGSFSEDTLLVRLANEGQVIRGLAMEGTSLRGVITSEEELAFAPTRIPRVRVANADANAGTPVVQPGDTIRVMGWGFAPTRDDAGTVRIILDETALRDQVTVDATGAFSAVVVVDRPIGDYDIHAEQREGLRLSRTTVPLLVVARDLPQVQGVPR